MEEKNKREYSFDVIKIIATILIVFHHYQQVEKVAFSGINFYGGNFYFGYMVELFFVLSGFFMLRYVSRILEGQTFKEFFLHRYLRLLPLLAISAIVYEIVYIIYVSVAGADAYKLITLWGTVIAALGIHNGWVFTNPDPAINNPTWYISILLLCYVVFFAFTYLAKRTKTSPWYYYIFLIFLGLGIRVYKINLPFLTPQVGRGYSAFFWGIILAKLFEMKPMKKSLYCASIVVFVSVPLLIIYARSFVSYGIDCIMTFIYYPALLILFSSPVLKRLFRFKWIGVLSKISFDVFVWHTCCLHLLDILRIRQVITANHKTPFAMILFTVIMFIIGTASYFWIEKPIDKRISLSRSGASRPDSLPNR